MRGETARNNEGLRTGIYMIWRRSTCCHVEVKFWASLSGQILSGTKVNG